MAVDERGGVGIGWSVAIFSPTRTRPRRTERWVAVTSSCEKFYKSVFSKVPAVREPCDVLCSSPQ